MSEIASTPSAPVSISPETAAPDSALQSQPVDNASVPSGKPAAAKQAPKEPLMAAAKKQYKIKVDHGEESVDFDASNDEEVKKHLQLSRVAQKRMQQTAEMQRGVQELLDTLRTNPLKVLTDPRLKISTEDRHKLAEAIMNDQIQEMAKSPEQKEKEHLQKEYERLQEEVKKEREQREQSENMRLQEQAAVQYDTDISSAIEASGLPKNARTIRYYAEALKFCVQNDLNLSAKDLTPYVKKQALSEFREVMTGLTDDDFANFLGKDGLSRIRQRNIAKSKAIPTSPNEIKETGANSKNAKSKEVGKKISYADFFKKF